MDVEQRVGAAAASERRFEIFGAHQPGPGIDVGKDNFGAGKMRGTGGGQEGDRRHDHFGSKSQA